MAQSESNQASTGPPAIGRYLLRSKLGTGSQGIVYLADDPELGRQVAIKTLTRSAADGASLLREARNAGRLKHPHIAAVFDIGSRGDTPYVVYEHVAGRSLRSIIGDGACECDVAVRWICEVLDGIDYAHAQGIVHRDLNPNNIMIDADGSAKVLDFGISTLAGTSMTPGEALVGTVNYMAPEQISAGTIGPATDVFAIGLIAFELLSGRRAVDLDDPMAAMYRISHEVLASPSEVNGAIGKKFDGVIQRALAKDPAERYLSARAMREALQNCACDQDTVQTPADDKHLASKKATLAFLIRRMRRKSDFPAISERISEINQLTQSTDDTSVSEVANSVLKDYALTTKLLKLVNSSFYGQFGGEITTVSRAVVILGIKQVRTIAQTLLLFEHLDNQPQAKKLKETASHAVLSGIVARRMSEQIPMEGSEEAFICSMVHTLGRYLTLFYLPEEYADIEAAKTHRRTTENAACREVLGLTFEDLGVGIAGEWNFPDSIVDTMRALPEGPVKAHTNDREALHHVTSFSSELCQAITQEPVDARRLQELCRRFESSLSLDESTVAEIVKRALEDARDFGSIINADFESSQVFKVADAWSRGESLDTDPVGNAQTDTVVNQGTRTDETGSALIMKGIQDVTHALIEECSLNDILSMILETIFRGLGVTRVVLCIADRRQGRMVARFGLGKNIDRFIEKLSFPLDDAQDAFSEMTAKHQDVVLPGSLDASNLPAWYRRLVSPKAMALLPIVVSRTCLGCIYCDVEDGEVTLDAERFNYLNTLRNQAALALKQGRGKR